MESCIALPQGAAPKPFDGLSSGQSIGFVAYRQSLRQEGWGSKPYLSNLLAPVWAGAVTRLSGVRKPNVPDGTIG